MIKDILKKLADKKDLDLHEAGLIVDIFAQGEATPSQIATFLTALKMKGETVEEMTGFAQRMRELALHVDTSGLGHVTDSCGTGGDHSNTFNISTASAILASSAGACVAKHSNYGFTSMSGSSNVLEALGISLCADPNTARLQLKEKGLAFLHAPHFHNSTRHVGPVRKEIGIRTVYNFLGPLTNPALPKGQVIGVSNGKMAEKIVQVAKNLGLERAIIAFAENPLLDELSVCGNTTVYTLKNGTVKKTEVTPEDFGIQPANLSDIEGGSSEENARIINGIFDGSIIGPKADAVALNAAAILWAAKKAESLEQGITMSREALQSGQALKKLRSLQTEK